MGVSAGTRMGVRVSWRACVWVCYFLCFLTLDLFFMFVLFHLYQQHAAQHNLHFSLQTTTIRSRRSRMSIFCFFSEFSGSHMDTDIDVKVQPYKQPRVVPSYTGTF